MSYNILADRLSSLPKFCKYVPAIVRDFEFRSKRIVGEIMQSKADIVCLQEVDNFDEYYEAKLAMLGYKTLFRPKAAEEVEQRHGVSVSFKTDRFELVTHKWIEMDDMLLDMHLGNEFRRANHAVFCLFRHLPSMKYLVVANTHLFHNPYFDFVKHAQAAYLLLHLAKYVRESISQLELIDTDFAEQHNTTLPLVFAGDFNSKPCSSAMSVLHGEDMNSKQWHFPPELADPLTQDIPKEVKEIYRSTERTFKTWEAEGQLSPLLGNLNSAYNFYHSAITDPVELSFEGLKRALN